MQQIRTTITLPMYLHRVLKQEALDRGKSFNQLLLDKLGGHDSGSDLEEKIAGDIAFFREIGRMGNQEVDLLEALRQDRDR